MEKAGGTAGSGGDVAATVQHRERVVVFQRARWPARRLRGGNIEGAFRWGRGGHHLGSADRWVHRSAWLWPVGCAFRSDTPGRNATPPWYFAGISPRRANRKPLGPPHAVASATREGVTV